MSTRILVVENHEATRLALSELLADEGYSVETAADGLEALERFERNPPDLILSDLRMPRMSGEELLERLRRLHSEVPIIVITARPEADRANLGIVDVITKPIDFADVLDQIAQIARTEAAKVAQVSYDGAIAAQNLTDGRP